MKVEHLTNRLANFGTELQAQLALCSSFTIATAFVSAETIALLEQTLKAAEWLKDCRLLIGIYGGFAQKSDLERLLLLAQCYAGRVSIRVSRNPAFHWKYYALSYPQKEVMYSGSANFTGSGLVSNAELMVKLSLNTRVAADAKIGKSLTVSFDAEWKESASIAEFPLADYPAIQRKQKVTWPKSLQDFFDNSGRKKTEAGAQAPVDKAFVTYLTTSVSASTTKALYNYNPLWEQRDISFFIDYCDSIKTADGKYFVAYHEAGKWKRINAVLEEALKTEFDIDLRARKKPFFTKVLRKQQLKRMEELINPN